MRKAKLPIAVFIVLIAVALVFAGCVQTTSVTVNFVYPDGSTASQVYQSDEGSPIISEVPDAKYIAGKHFTGWYLDQACTQPVKFPYKLEGIETLTLYANYVAGYAVTLSGGHGQAYATVPQTDPTLTEAPDPGTSPSGQTFMGWYLDSGFTKPVTYPYTVTSAGATFYASWQTVDPNSAVISLTGSKGAQSAAFALNSQINASDLDHGTDSTGATFAGWYLDAACTQPVTFPYTVTGNATFYAKWEEAGYTVTFNTMGGDPMPSRKLMVIPGSGNTPDEEFIPTREGYVFQGWYQSEADALAGRRKMSFPFDIRGDRTIFAGWTEELDPNEVQQFTSTKAPYDAFKEIFSRYSEAVGWEEGMYSIALEADVEGGLITLHADVLQDGGTGEFKPNDLMFKVEKFDDNTTFGIYISDNRMFIDVGGENGLYEITDIQSDYIAAIIAKVPGLLDELLDSVDLSGLDMLGGLEGIISIVFGIFFDNARITRTISNEVILEHPDKDPADLNALYTDYKIEIKLNTFTSGIADLLQLINLGSLLGFDLNLSALFSWLNEVIPQYKVIFETEFYSPDSNPDATVTSIHPRIDVTYNDPENEETLGQPAWNFGIASVTLGDAVSDVEGFLDFPDNVDAALEGTGTATEFSFTNLQFDIDLTLGTGKEGETLKKLDVGKLIKMFTDTVKIPEGLIVLESDFGYKLRAQVDLDLDYDMIASGKFVDNNIILLELYPLDQFGNMDEDNKAMGIYYKEGKLYISLSSLIPNYWKANNIVIDLGGVPELIAKVVTTVRGAIDDALFKDDGTAGGTENVSVQGLSATSANQLALADGGYQLNPTLGSFIETLCEVLAIPDGVLEVDGDRIVLNVQKIANEQQVGEDGTPVVDDEGKPVYVDNDIFDFIDRFMGIAGQDPISGLIPDGISGKLEFVFFEGGLKSIDISGSIAPDATQGINVGLSINNFLIGVKDGELEARVEEGIGDTENYTNNLGELLGSALEGIDLNMNLALTFDAGQYNIGEFIAGLGVGELAGVPLSWTFENAFQMDLGMHVKLSLDQDVPTNSAFAVEIVANKEIFIGDSTAAQPAGLLVGIYGFYDEGVGRVAVDLSNIVIAGIQFPQLSAKLDFAGLIFGLLDKLQIDFGNGPQSPGDINLSFNLSDLIGGDEGTSSSASAAAALSNDVFVENPGETINNTELTDAGMILVGLNSEALYASFTLAALQEVLTQFGVSLGEIDLSSFDIAASLDLSRLDGITVTAEGTLMPKANVAGGASTDQNLRLQLALGTDEYPISVGMTDELKSALDAMKEQIEGNLSEYKEEVIALVLDTVSKSRIELEMDLHTLDSQMNMTDIINNILASQGKQLELPIDMYLDEWNPVVTLVVEWQLDVADGNIGQDSVLQISLVYEGKELFGVALDRGDAIVKLAGLGLFNIRLASSPLIESLIEMVRGVIDKASNMELGDLIDGLVNGVDGSTAAIDASAAAASSPEAGAETPKTETPGESGQLEPWIKALLRSISANNTTLLVKLTTDIVDEVVRGLAGFSLGIDIGLDGELDIVDGALSFTLTINDNIRLDAVLTLAIGSDAVDRLMLTQEQIDRGEHYTIDVGTDATTIDGTDGASMAQGLFDNLNLSLSLDILNNTADTGNQNEYLRVSIQKLNTDTPLANTGGRVAPRGTFLIQVGTVDASGYDNTMRGMDTFVYAILDYNASTISIYVKEGWIKLIFGLDVGNIVNKQNLRISLASDSDGDGKTEGIIEQIGALLDGLISDLENMGSSTPTEKPETDGSTTETPSTETPSTEQPAASESALDMTPLTDLFADLDIMQLLGGGIDIKFNATGTFNADITFDPYTINKLIDDMMDLIFGPNSILDLGALAPEMFTQHHLRNVNWDRDGGFWADLADCIKKNMLPDIVSSPTVTAAVGVDLSGLLGMFSGTVDDVLAILKPIVTAILPLPVFNELNAGLNFVDGTFANIYITGDDTGAPIVSEDGTVYDRWAHNDANEMQIWIYNQFDSVGAPGNVTDGTDPSGGIVDWGEIPKTVVYEPYQYNGGASYTSFVSSYFENKTARFQRGTHVMRAPVTFTFKGGEHDGRKVADVLNSDQGLLNRIAAAGGNIDNPLEITVSANFSGTERSITIYLAVQPMDSPIESITPLTRYAYDPDPAYLILNFADGTSRSVAWSAVASNDIAPEGYRAHVKAGSVTFVNGTTADVTVNYLDSVAEKLVNADDLSMSVDLYSMTSTSTNITEFTPEVLYFNYPDGAAVAMKVDAWENTETLNGLLAERAQQPANMSAIYGTITAVIGQGTPTEQRIDIDVNIRTKNVTSVKYGEFRNAIQINPYDIYLQETHPEDKSYTVLPSQAVAYYNEDLDSYNETVYINITNFSLDLSLIGWKTSDQTTVDVSLDKSKYGGYFGWTMEDVPVNVVLNTISKIWFVDPDSPTGYSDRLIIDPYVYNSLATTEEKEAYFPTSALIEFSNGYSCELPIRFPKLDVEKLYVEYDSYNDQQLLEIGFAPEGWTATEAEALETRFLQQTYVYFEFEGKEIARYNIAGADGHEQTYLEIDPVEVLLRGTNPLPDSVEVIYTDGTTETIDVNAWDGLTISTDSLGDTDGSTGTVTGHLTGDGRNNFTINYRILPRYGMSSEKIVFDSYDYSFDSNGNISFDVLYDTIAVSFKDGTTTEVPIYEEGVPTGKTETIDTVHTYYIGVVQWETGGANFGSGNNAGGIVTAVFEDVYNNDYVTLDIDLIAETLQPVTDEAGNFVVTYLGLDYILATGTMGADGKLSSIFDNFDSSQLANRRIDNATVTMTFYTGEEDEEGNKLTTMRVVKADIELDTNVPTDVDAFNAAGRIPFDYSLGTSPVEQGATKFTATVTVYDGANTAQKSVVLPLYFGYDGSALTGATA